MRRRLWTPLSARNCVGFPYKIIMAVTLICPKCQASTELRGMMDVWYLTWCPDCERLWRVGMWTLLDTEPPDSKRVERGAEVKT
jgi:ribosomal protein L37AE/L43A